MLLPVERIVGALGLPAVERLGERLLLRGDAGHGRGVGVGGVANVAAAVGVGPEIEVLVFAARDGDGVRLVVLFDHDVAA